MNGSEPDNSMKSSFKEEWSAKKASSDIPKPQNSRVILRKDEESLEIIFPSPGLSKGYVSLIIVGVMFIIPSITLVAILFGIYWADLSSKIVLALFSIPWWTFALAMFLMFANSLGTMLSNTRLEINQQRISLSHEIFEFKIYEEKSNQRQDINNLERIKRHIKLSSLPDYVPDYLGSIYESEIIIWAGESKYRISISLVSEDELDWLATELSDWLGLPINKP
ncbi:hypothetical protein WA1_03975 [Scytonema hofmannii PCC 7110]|uniref:Uncharacterized protein n=1 Tax=Scytonema hofmannii PCC 7110 TaxID=128403 RepID=A0A139X4G6_9CYAN|nr:hypothetical protein [Scytonema hofmannii]KYC39597.1 hypothetical protein WA1_03975 [Scytonema hofmannii PCC 7110]